MTIQDNGQAGSQAPASQEAALPVVTPEMVDAAFDVFSKAGIVDFEAGFYRLLVCRMLEAALAAGSTSPRNEPTSSA